MAPCGNCPMVPTTSGWPAWPMRMMWRPRLKWSLRLPVHLGDERTCGVDGEEPPRRGGRGNRFRHAVGGKDHGRARRQGSRRAPGRRPRPSSSGPPRRTCCGRSRGGHRPAHHRSASALSTASIARTTPAQKPRGAQSRIWRGGFVMMGVTCRCQAGLLGFPGIAARTRCSRSRCPLRGQKVAPPLGARLHSLRSPQAVRAAPPSPASAERAPEWRRGAPPLALALRALRKGRPNSNLRFLWRAPRPTSASCLPS